MFLYSATDEHVITVTVSSQTRISVITDSHAVADLCRQLAAFCSALHPTGKHLLPVCGVLCFLLALLACRLRASLSRVFACQNLRMAHANACCSACMFLIFGTTVNCNSNQRIFVQLVGAKQSYDIRSLTHYFTTNIAVWWPATAGVHSLPAPCARVRIFRLSDFWAHPSSFKLQPPPPSSYYYQ